MPRGLADKTQHLIAESRSVLERIRPETCRGVAYQLFIKKVTPDMSKRTVKRVERVLLIARERGLVPWSWVVDETREIEAQPAWDEPDAFAEDVKRTYRRDRWKDQSVRLMVVSEKGTVRGVLKPVLDRYGVPFLVMHGYGSATVVHNLATQSADPHDDRPFVMLYVGDFDPSGLSMSEEDLPSRMRRYGGNPVIRRVALRVEDVGSLPSFPAADKKRDSRYRWYIEHFGSLGGQCWELDAMNPNMLRARVESELTNYIDEAAWQRAAMTEAAELASLTDVLHGWQALSVFSTGTQNTGGLG